MELTVYFATDHAGFDLKNSILEYVQNELGYSVIDCGAYEYNPHDDYPDYIHNATKYIGDNPDTTRAIIFGHSGQGEAIVANRHNGVRAVVYAAANSEIIALSREHNNANVLSIGAHFVSEAEAKEAVLLWLKTPFSGEERHVRRIRKIEGI